MSGQPEIRLRDMTLADVDAVLRIEQKVHSHPWTPGNFSDALHCGYICKVYELADEMVGYAVLMPALDEVHLLDLSIAGNFQRKGLGEKLLGEMLALVRTPQYERVILEVRRSNLAASALYRKAGFQQIGVRRAYYPADKALPANSEREDAIVMEYKLK